MYGIRTVFLGPTDTLPSRVRAKAGNGKSSTVYWDHDINVEKNHQAAAMALISKLGWHGVWYGGSDHEGGFYFVRKDETSKMECYVESIVGNFT